VIERIIEYSIKNRFVVLAGVFAVALWGVYSIAHTPIDAIPDLSENQVIVFADWMGRSPKEIEDQVTYPLSVNLQGLAGVKAVRSTSEFNFSMVNVIFEDGVDFYFARERVLERLSIASTFLPAGVVPYLAPDATALGQILWYTVEGKDQDLSELRAVQDWYVRYQLNSVPGVAQVSSVGGFVRTYEISLDPNRLRAYGMTLGDVIEAVSRSNSAVGGNVLVKNEAEYLVRGIGWIADLEDLRRTVVGAREGVPVTLDQLGSVAFAPEPRRSVLEKDGREAVGGVVLMRYGENPLAVTDRIKAKIAELTPGLPEGVRIVPFYDRTRLIHGAIHTVTGVLREEMVIAGIAILLILTHAGSALVVVLTLPLAVLISFILMRLFHIPSNIMSLSGIAISIGVLVDAAIVMVENATHELTARFGSERVSGDTREIILNACRLVGRPIFFSVLIMLISFLPVFVLTGMEGKMFHPLAFTKSFAMIGVAILSITFVPALLPVFLRGRLRGEMENPIVRSLIEIYKPVLTFLLRHPKPFLLSFVLLLGIGWNLAGRLGREFMPPLDEGSVMDMPVTIPSVSVSKAADDLRVRDEMLRSFPEVESVVGKVGRADTPTDPAPPDMVETVVNLRPKSWWPKRKIDFEDVGEEAGRTLERLERLGAIEKVPEGDARASLLNDAAMSAAEDVDRVLRAEARAAQRAALPELAFSLTAEGVDDLLAQAGRKGGLRRALSPEERRLLVAGLAAHHGPALVEQAALVDVTRLLEAARDSLVTRGLVEERVDLFVDPPSVVDRVAEPVRTLLGTDRPSFEQRAARAVDRARDEFWRKRAKQMSYALADLAPGALLDALAHRLHEKSAAGGLSRRELAGPDLAQIREERERSLARGLFLWRKKKEDLVQEMDSALQMPGWGNIWTQPIINRIDMLATGVRTMVGVKVFGDDLYGIQRVSEEIAQVLRGIPGAVDVFPDQIVGENYIEIEVDREKAARYGINVGDVQEVIEVALGGMTITNTVEGRRRFPVRVRYASDFRADEQSVGEILVAGMPMPGSGPSSGGMGGRSPGSGASREAGMPWDGLSAALAGPLQVPLREVATIRVVEGPSMIKSENGLLRSYVQLNVRGRDVVGFVEDARRVIQEKVKLAPGYYLEWSGQFEHQVRAKKTLSIVFPAVIGLIFLILYLTFHDLAHACLMVLAVPGALVGGVIFQTIFGFHFSVAVWVGYIAAFGMATETGIVMMVYLRDAMARRGGLAGIQSEEEIKAAVVEGAVHRLRPKLLTEGVAIVGLMPMLWAHGTGAEVMRPMAAPVLGGLLMADEVIDLLLPVLFHWVERGRWRRLRGRAA
jgi:Cu(I)/Ag(I) efflux system membrane protein CusA/SilA